MLLTERIAYQHDHLTISNDVAIPIAESCNSTVASFRLAEKLFQVVVGSGNVIMIVAGKQTFPESHESTGSRWLPLLNRLLWYRFA
jgi:hypothetical protein